MPIIPNITDQLPEIDKRLELFRLDAEQVMKYVTPGFGMFISRFTDDMLVHYFKNKDIDKYQKNVPSHIRYLFLIRAVWKNLLSEAERIKWEKIATQEPHFAQLGENGPELFDSVLKREINRKLYENSEAYLEFERRAKLYKQSFASLYKLDLGIPSDSLFEKTVNLSIDVDYSASIMSPHSIQLLKVFLSLEQFVNVLMECDKGKAIELLKQTVNYIPQQTDYLRPILQKLLPQSSSQDLNLIESSIRTSAISSHSNDGERLDYRQLAFYPLLILEKLLCRFSPDQVGLQKAVDFRHQALKLGVMDFVLECLSHFTHQRSTSKKIRSWRMPLTQYSVRFSSNMQTNKNSSDVDSDNSQNESSNNANRNKTYFAKGTGYGSGDTKQMWDLKDCEMKIQFDDNNIACLLNILRAFILPPINASTSDMESGSKKNNQRKNKTEPTQLQGATSTATDILTGRNKIPMEDEFLRLLKRSCLRSVIRSYLMSGSLLEINKNISTYHAVFQLLVALSNSPSIEIDIYGYFGDQCEDDIVTEENDEYDENVTDDAKSNAKERESVLPFDIIFSVEDNDSFKSERDEIIGLLEQFSSNINEYLKRIAPELTKHSNKQIAPGYFDFFAFFGFGSAQKKERDKVVDDRQLQELSNICKEVVSIFKKKNASEIEEFNNKLKELKMRRKLKLVEPTAGCSQTAKSTSFEMLTDAKKYCDALKDDKFVTISFANIPYHYSAQLHSRGIAGSADIRIRRIAREIYSLRSGLMLTSSTSAFVISSEQNLDAMKVLITGPVDTPYSNGCFEFDFFFPSNFPQAPPQVNLQTTGNGSVRFNPNLYNCGKVCLSILGTWPGRPEEQWNSETSSVLQVITSIQSLILVNDPYFNEPGYERSINTPQGNLASKRYNSVIQIATIRWAMIENLKHPPRGFEKIVHRHFFLKMEEIHVQIKNWIAEWRNSQDSRCSSTADELERLLKQLNDEFQKLQKMNLDL